jgi:hypothetical protein
MLVGRPYPPGGPRGKQAVSRPFRGIVVFGIAGSAGTPDSAMLHAMDPKSDSTGRTVGREQLLFSRTYRPSWLALTFGSLVAL